VTAGLTRRVSSRLVSKAPYLRFRPISVLNGREVGG